MSDASDGLIQRALVSVQSKRRVSYALHQLLDNQDLLERYKEFKNEGDLIVDKYSAKSADAIKQSPNSIFNKLYNNVEKARVTEHGNSYNDFSEFFEQTAKEAGVKQPLEISYLLTLFKAVHGGKLNRELEPIIKPVSPFKF